MTDQATKGERKEAIEKAKEDRAEELREQEAIKLIVGLEGWKYFERRLRTYIYQAKDKIDRNKSLEEIGAITIAKDDFHTEVENFLMEMGSLSSPSISKKRNLN